MPTVIDRAEVMRLIRDGAQVVDVLPKQEYREQHIPGAVSIPLKEIDARSDQELNRKRPVITYCWDYQ